jgi:hypothetical protein
MIVKAAAILFLIALSACAEKVDANDPPTNDVAAEPGTDVRSDMPAETMVDSPPAAESPAKAENEPPMRSPVLLD